MATTPRAVRKAIKLQQQAEHSLAYGRMGVDPEDVYEVTTAFLNAVRGAKDEKGEQKES